MGEIVNKTCSTNLFGYEGYAAAITAGAAALAGLANVNYGIITNVRSSYKDDSTGYSVSLGVLGKFPARAGAAVTEGAYVEPDATGRFIACASGDTSMARAYSAADAAADVFDVIISNVAAPYEMP